MKPKFFLIQFLAISLGLAACAFAQYPRGGSQAGNDDVWVRVVNNENTGGRTVTRHNGNTRIQEVVTYDAYNRPVLKRTYRLNRYGQPSDFLIYDSRGAVIYRGEFVYDLQSRLGEERLYAMPANTMVRRLTYNPLDPKAKPKTQIYGAGVAPEVLESMAEGGPERVGGGRPPAETARSPRQPQATSRSNRNDRGKKKGGFLNKIFGG